MSKNNSNQITKNSIKTIKSQNNNITKINNTWYKIEHGSKLGYINKDYVLIDRLSTEDDDAQAKQVAKDFIKELGLASEIDFNKNTEYKFKLDAHTTALFTYGMEPFIDDSASLKVNLIEGKFDDSTLPGLVLNHCFNIGSMFSKFVTEFITKATAAFKFGELELKTDIINTEMELKCSKSLENKEFGYGFKIYMKLVIKTDIPDEDNKQLNEAFNKALNKFLDRVSSLVSASVQNLLKLAASALIFLAKSAVYVISLFVLLVMVYAVIEFILNSPIIAFIGFILSFFGFSISGLQENDLNKLILINTVN